MSAQHRHQTQWTKQPVDVTLFYCRSDLQSLIALGIPPRLLMDLWKFSIDGVLPEAVTFYFEARIAGPSRGGIRSRRCKLELGEPIAPIPSSGFIGHANLQRLSGDANSQDRGFKKRTHAAMVKRRKSFDPKLFVAKCGAGRTIENYRMHEVVFSQGDPADAVFYILTGQVKVAMVSEQGKEAVVAIHEPDNFFGQRCLAGQPYRTATVTAIADAVIMRLEKATILHAIRTQSKFSEMFIDHLLKRFIRIEADLIDQLFNSSEERLARLLLFLAKCNKKEKQESEIVNFTHEMLAEKIGTTRARVSFFMNRFRRLGLVDYHGNVIHVHGSRLTLMLHEPPHTMD